ncbi:MAG: NADH-quinone oxidoreductase subunit M, partial [Chloroflexota bacterium]
MGLGDRRRRRDHDRVLHVPADRPDLLGREPRGQGRRAQDPRIATGHDDPTLAARDPVPPAGPVPLLARPAARAAVRPARTGTARRLARTRLRPGTRDPRPSRIRVRDLRHRRRADPDLRRGRGHRHGRRVAPVRGRDRGPPSARQSRAGARADREGPVPVSSLPQQVVVRRDQPRPVRPGRRSRGRVSVVVRRERRRRHRERHRRGDPAKRRRPRPRPDRTGPELCARHRGRAHRHGRVLRDDGEGLGVDGFPILSIITFLPLVGALVIAFLPATYARPVALGAALLTWIVSLLLVVGFAAGRGGLFQFTEELSWIPTFGIEYKLGVDGLSLLLVVLTTTLSWISILASFKPIQTRIKEYMISFLILEVGMIGVFLALDTFLFYIFWEIVLVPMYLIIGIWGGANRIYATIKFVLYTLVGSLLMLVAILATAFAFQAAHGGDWTGAFDYEVLRLYAATAGGFDPTLQLLAFGAFFLAFAIKVPMFPFHTWLPDAHVEAPTAGSVILAGVLLKLGAYGFIRYGLSFYPDAADRKS